MMYFIIIYCMAILTQGALGRDPDNQVAGSPVVECNRDFIKVTVPTRKPFRGRVYVQGESKNPECVRDYSNPNHAFAPSFAPSRGGHGGYGASGGRGGNTFANFGPSGSTNFGQKTTNGGSRTGKVKSSASNQSKNGAFGSSTQSGATRTTQVPSGWQAHPNRQSTEATWTQPQRQPGFPTPPPTTARWQWTRPRTPAASAHIAGGGFRVLPDENGECPTICPPCADCRHDDHDLLVLTPRRLRRDTPTDAVIEVKLDSCNSQRDRSLNPPGIMISFTVHIQFHDSLVTKPDRAYHVSCSYIENESTVTADLDVSPLPDSTIEGYNAPPKCQYQMVLPAGRSSHLLSVGDEVEHVWACTSDSGVPAPDLHRFYGLLVYNCFVEDGKGTRRQVIDAEGCSMEPLVLGDLQYSNSALAASVKSQVIKFPDRDTIEFHCAMRVCHRDYDSCNAITPPRCNGRQRRSTDPDTNAATPTADEWRLHSPRLTVMDIDTNFSQFDLDQLTANQATVSAPLQSEPDFLKRQQCLSVLGFGLAVAVATFLVTVSGTVLAGLCFLRSSKPATYPI